MFVFHFQCASGHRCQAVLPTTSEELDTLENLSKNPNWTFDAQSLSPQITQHLSSSPNSAKKIFALCVFRVETFQYFCLKCAIDYVQEAHQKTTRRSLPLDDQAAYDRVLQEFLVLGPLYVAFNAQRKNLAYLSAINSNNKNFPKFLPQTAQFNVQVLLDCQRGQLTEVPATSSEFQKEALKLLSPRRGIEEDYIEVSPFLEPALTGAVEGRISRISGTSNTSGLLDVTAGSRSGSPRSSTKGGASHAPGTPDASGAEGAELDVIGGTAGGSPRFSTNQQSETYLFIETTALSIEPVAPSVPSKVVTAPQTIRDFRRGSSIHKSSDYQAYRGRPDDDRRSVSRASQRSYDQRPLPHPLDPTSGNQPYAPIGYGGAWTSAPPVPGSNWVDCFKSCLHIVWRSGGADPALVPMNVMGGAGARARSASGSHLSINMAGAAGDDANEQTALLAAAGEAAHTRRAQSKKRLSRRKLMCALLVLFVIFAILVILLLLWRCVIPNSWSDHCPAENPIQCYFGPNTGNMPKFLIDFFDSLYTAFPELGLDSDIQNAVLSGAAKVANNAVAQAKCPAAFYPISPDVLPPAGASDIPVSQEDGLTRAIIWLAKTYAPAIRNNTNRMFRMIAAVAYVTTGQQYPQLLWAASAAPGDAQANAMLEEALGYVQDVAKNQWFDGLDPWSGG